MHVVCGPPTCSRRHAANGNSIASGKSRRSALSQSRRLLVFAAHLELTQDVVELLGIERLGNEAVHAGLLCAVTILLEGIGGDRDDGDR